jgi:hypothetical protein
LSIVRCARAVQLKVKARSLPLSGAPERIFNRSSFTNKHETRLERLARYKHFSLLRKFINYGQKNMTFMLVFYLGAVKTAGVKLIFYRRSGLNSTL